MPKYMLTYIPTYVGCTYIYTMMLLSRALFPPLLLGPA